MKLIITGSGGREHALVKKLSENTAVDKIYCLPGNGGTASEPLCENIDLDSPEKIALFAKDQQVDLVIPGSEDLLVAGVVDELSQYNIKALGPPKKAALLEGSKGFAKDFMAKYGVKTASYKGFTHPDQAKEYIKTHSYPLVVKADGLAAGKGVIICQTIEEALRAIDDIMVKKIFNHAGDSVVIEEFLEGVEASILSFYDGKTILPLLSAKDHKKIGEGETGLNTGGMGVIAPNPFVTDQVMSLFQRDILEPTLRGLDSEGLGFAGVIFFGLMINQRGVYLLEYNLRMGDPETQAVLPLLKSDLLTVIEAACEGQLDQVELEWKKESSCCVVLASGGYPEAYEKGFSISGLQDVDCPYFLAGAQGGDNGVYTSGGRVLNVVSCGKTLEEARQKAYNNIKKIHFEKMVYRRDIGRV